jgi:hypothetical protein
MTKPIGMKVAFRKSRLANYTSSMDLRSQP